MGSLCQGLDNPKTPECIWCSQHCLADSGSAAVDEPRTFWHSSHRQEVKPRWTAFFSGCVSVDVPSPSGHVTWSLWNQLQNKFWFLRLCLRADEDNESSSSEDDNDDRRRLNDELLGQVCSIENEEESSTWFLALVNWHSYCIKWGWCYNYLMYVITNHCRWNIHVTLLKWGKGLFSCCQKVNWDVRILSVKDRITEQHKNRVDYMMDCEDLDCPHSKLDWRFYYFVRYLKCSLFSFNLISSSLATKWAFLPSQHICIFIGNVMLFFQPWQNIRNIVKCVTVVYKATNQCALNNKQNKERKKANPQSAK